MMSRYIHKYCRIIVQNLRPRYIPFPQSQDEIDMTKRSFEQLLKIRGMLGVIDGTHVDLSSVTSDIEHQFIDRRGHYSINVQLICNANMVFTNVNACFPGCSKRFDHISK